MTPAALDGITVIDLSRVLAAPYCTMLLADMGADVIKVERPGSGDDTRQWGPPWVGGQSAYFLTVNRNKRSLTLDLKTKAGQAILRQLIAKADILIENFKVGTLAQWGLEYESLRPHNPGLIFCSVTGYGQTGPYRQRPGYDFMIQAQGGIMSITGPQDGEAHKVGVAIADITTGLYATQAILAALYHRTRSGEGQMIDVALLDSQIGWLANVASNYFATGETPGRYGNAHPNLVPYQTFSTADGAIALAIGNDRQYRDLCITGGAPQLWHDSRYQTNAGRVAQRAELVPQLQQMFQQRTSDEWMALLLQIDVPASPINDVAAALEDPHVQSRQMVQTVEHPIAGPSKQLGPVVKLSGTPARIRSAPPLLGEHTTDILHELGYSAEQIEQLRQEAVI